MQGANYSELYEKYRERDISAVKQLIPKLSPDALNRSEPNGSNILHLASSNGDQEIILSLLQNGVSCQIKDADGKTPKELAPNEETQQLFIRCPKFAESRFGEPKIKWLLGNDYAKALARALRWRRIKNRGIEKTVRKLKRSGILGEDESNANRLLQYYLDEAIQKNNPVFLLKIYTIEGPFFKRFNEYMAEGSDNKVYKKLCHKWSGYYSGILMNTPEFKEFQYSGITYRGMIITQEDFEQYKIGFALTNKAFQSTSKSKEVALNFAHRRELESNEIPFILMFQIIDPASALDITNISEYPEEEEVLMLPGVCFEVSKIDYNGTEYEVYMQQHRVSYL